MSTPAPEAEKKNANHQKREKQNASVELLLKLQWKKSDEKKGKHIQLLFGIVSDKSKEKSIKLNLSPNFRKDVLFGQLPYLAHLENPVIVEVVENGIVDGLSLQNIF